MLIYGDQERRIEPYATLTQLAEDYRRLAGLPAGIVRHGALVALFIDAAALAQGLADAAFEACGADDLSPDHAALLDLLVGLADAVRCSWDGGFTAGLPDRNRTFEAMFALPLPTMVAARRAEGFAYYGVYPELYLTAARTCSWDFSLVVGLRSIGMALAAMVGCAHPRALVASVRPTGPPFRRTVALAPDLKTALARKRRGHAAIVDEGPGLSGSSFAAVADALAGLGFARERIHFFPSHPGEPGPEAAPEARERWRAAPRHLGGFEDAILHTPTPEHRLANWCADLTGPAIAPLEDVGAGKWRRHRSGAGDVPIQRNWERRKYLLRSEAGTFLLKFAGLGRYGEETLSRAQALAQAGFTPHVLGLRHGFLVQEWCADARFLTPTGDDRRALLTQLEHYLSFRARALPAAPASGACLVTLAEMLATNGQAALGVAWRGHRLLERARELERRVRRVQTDNRLHSWEWLGTSRGILKADAFDHCAAHDLVGCQDIAWDVAGAIVEFQLSTQETDGLIEAAAADRDLVTFLHPCYLAAQIAAFSYALADRYLSWEDIITVKRKYEGYVYKLSVSIFNFI